MQWQSWADFWQMGGNGVFVWASYGAWLVLMLWELWQLRRTQRATLRQLLRWRKATRHQARSAGNRTAPPASASAGPSRAAPACITKDPS